MLSPIMTSKSSNRSTQQNVTTRRAFIEHRLFWRGRIGLADLTETLGLSRTQSSMEINNYIKAFPEHLAYDPSARAYFPGREFQPHFTSLDVDRHLAKLLAIANDADVSNADWELYRPDMLAPPVPARGAKAEIARDILLAIEQKRQLHITYQSMTSPDPTKRSIVPHALAHDGFRWHCRALCLRDGIYKDFVLGRMSSVGLGEKAGFNPAEDTDWTAEITLMIAPHPNLSENQSKVVTMDYGMIDGSAEITVRKCMLYYTLKRLGLDADPAARRAQDQHIVLVNAKEVFAAMGRTLPW